MDGIDVGILRTMGIDHWGRRPKGLEVFKPSYLARRLGTTDETVRQRLRRLETIGVLRGYQVVPNLKQIGLEATCYFLQFRTDEAADAALAAVKAIPGLIGTFSYVGGKVCANLSFGDSRDQEAKLRALNAASADASVLKYYDLDMPPVVRPLSALDWRIIKALRGKALRPVEEVGQEVGVAGRTVKRRIDRMAKEGSFVIVPRLDLSRADGMIPLAVNVHFGDEATPATANRVASALQDRIVATYVPAAAALGHLSLGMFAASVAEVGDLRRRIESVPGVARAESLIIRGATSSFAWIEHAIDDRIASAAGRPSLVVA